MISNNRFGAISVLTVSIFALVAVPLTAHRLIRTEEPPNHYSKAIEIEHPQVSQVYYSELDPQSPQTWFAFDAKAGERIDLGLGVPVIERLRDFKPLIAILGGWVVILLN